MPTPEESYAIILAGAEPNERQKLARELVDEKRVVDPTLPEVAQRRRMESEIRRKSGRGRIVLQTELVLMYDELSDAGLLERRRAR